jgi:hypothetical protein
MSAHSLCGRFITPARAVHSVSAYSVLRVDSTIARSVTGPEARVSITIRLRTAGEAAIATIASDCATSARTSSCRST